MNDLELKRKRIETIVKIAALPVIGFFIAPFVFIAIKGLIGLLVAAAVSILAIQFAPVAAAKVANWRLKAIKAEAAKNPVETLQNEYKRRAVDLSHFEEKLRTFAAKVTTFASKVAEYAEKYPKEAATFKEQLSKMRELLEIRKGKFFDAKESLEDFSVAISKAKDKWEMSQAALAMALEAGQTEEEFFAKIQVETALDSIQDSLNTAFADLEISLVEEESAKAKEKVMVEDSDVTSVKVNRQKIATT